MTKRCPCPSDSAEKLAGAVAGAQVDLIRAKSRRLQIAHEVIRKLENQPQKVSTVADLQKPDIQAEVTKEVQALYRPTQLEMEGVTV